MTRRTEARHVAPDHDSERTVLVGRASELVEIASAFERGARVVTLLGAAGIGKTRLARRYATLRLRGASEVWFCDLAEGGTESAALAHVAEVLGVRLQPGALPDKSARVIAAALEKKGGALLVLDHAERGLAAAARLAREVAAGADASVLVGSREALGVSGEVRIDVPPLGLDDAATLFTGRAAALGVSVFADEEKVLGVVRRLEGVPLAIELAAAFTPVVDLATLDRMLSEGLGFLDQGARGDSLGGALEVSWGLLGAAERRALSGASVFRGGFDAAAARAVLGKDALTTVRALREKSLLRTDRVIDELRLGMFASVRAFAGQKLDASGERAEVERLHARYYASLSASGANAKLGAELDNLLAAHAHLVAEDAIASVEVLRGLGRSLARRGPLEAYVRAADATIRAIEASKQGDSEKARPLAEALAMRGEAIRMQGDIEGARADLDRAIELARAAKDVTIEARAHVARGLTGWLSGKDEEAEAHGLAALELATKAGDATQEGLARGLVGMAAQARRELETARGHLERAVALARRGDPEAEVVALTNLAVVEHELGLLERARDLYVEALNLARSLGDRRPEGPLVSALGQVALERGDLQGASARFDEALALVRELGVRRHEAMTLGRIGIIDLARGDAETARGHFGRADDLALGGMERRHGLYRAGAAASLAKLGDPAEAEKLLVSARAILGPVGDPGYVAAAWVLEGFVLLARGDEDGARARLDDDDPNANAVLRSSDARAAKVALLAALDGAPPVATKTSLRPPSALSLVVGADGRWFEATGPGRVDLSRRKALRLLLRALADQRVRAPGSALGLRELFAAGWPGERASALAAARRVYTAVGMLRDMGLRNALVRRDDGYLLDPGIAFDVRRAP